MTEPTTEVTTPNISISSFLYKLPAVCFLAIFFVACCGEPEQTIYIVTFDTDGGSTIDPVEASRGAPIAAPIPPTKTGAFFVGWYKDNTSSVPYNFNTPIRAAITLYAKWSYYNIPDDRFRRYLKGEVPNAFDGEDLQTDHQEVKALTTINVSGQYIASLEGIQYFIGLTELSCYSNQLSSLDVSNNTALEVLVCQDNQLSSLNVSNNTTLTRLECYINQLTSLDVSNTTALMRLDCRFNQLSSLDVSKNTALTQLYCASNLLSSLNVANNTALATLWCFSNRLSVLDVSANAALAELYCQSNQLSSLNMKANKNLKVLYVAPNDKLGTLLVHVSKLCDAGITNGSGVKGVFEANQEALDMRITSYDDNGKELQTYDAAGYEAACQ